MKCAAVAVAEAEAWMCVPAVVSCPFAGARGIYSNAIVFVGQDDHEGDCAAVVGWPVRGAYFEHGSVKLLARPTGWQRSG